MRQFIGVCLGASTVSFAKVQSQDLNNFNIEQVLSVAHNGNPKKVFNELLNKFNSNNLPVVVTGRKFRKLVALPTISEPEATEVAFEHLIQNKKDFTAIASIGGETFMVYSLDEQGKISNVITKNQCASGTGEFFLQQIKRMDINTDEVVSLALDSEPFKVSGRCSVFCKSDCTHALNKGVDKGSVASGLSKMMAEKIQELLKKNHQESILIIGGVTKNLAVMQFLRNEYPKIEIPESATYFEALGAAIYAMKNEVKPMNNNDSLFIQKDSSFAFLEPLVNFKEQVSFKSVARDTAKDGDVCILGLDVGSTTTKAVVIRQSDNKVLGSCYLYTHGNPIKAAKKCYTELLNQIPQKIKIIGLGTTGSGRHIAGLHALTDGVINEIVAHATAAIYFDPEVDTIFEIGGQDAKYTYIINKVPADYAMNEACSAGTGSFIEESAWEALGIKVTDIQDIALRGKRPPNFNDQCAAFINSDIKTALQENIDIEDVVAGLVYSICINYVNRVKGNRPMGKKIFMQGGVCYNQAIPIAMSALTGNEIIVPPEPGLMGAFGVALEVQEKLNLGFLEEKEFDLNELAEREVSYKSPFICAGGREKCDLKCSINRIEIQGKTYPFGGACNRYYNALSKTEVDSSKFDYIKIRHKLTFEKYVPEVELPTNAKTVGINNSFHTHTLYPLFYNFFTKLGFKVALSQEVKEEGLEREYSSFCYPAQLSLGLFKDLLDMNPDYYFLPGIMEMYVEDKEYHQKDNNCTCAFLNTEPYFLKQAFKDHNFADKVIHTIFNFAYGFHTQEEKFISVGKKLGIEDNSLIIQAYKEACKIQDIYQEELYAIGRQAIAELEQNPDDFAIVLVGRPYNSFTDIANKGIPQKFASRGLKVIPYDMFDFRNETIDDLQYWESGKKILKVAKVIKRHPQLYATYISNFSCAPDSIIITLFRTIMGTKPSLTLELDGHTADSGINTRIDAAVDIIKNYRKISNRITDAIDNNYAPAKISFEPEMVYFVSSEGEKIPITDKRVKILIPSMGDLSSKLIAAAFRNQKLNAIAMPEANPDVLKYGRQNTTGKECLPLILCVGAMMDYVENHWDRNEYVAFFTIQGSGDCRVGQYPVTMRDIINRRKLRNVTPLALSNEDGFAGMGDNFSIRTIQAIIAADVLDDIRSAIMANAIDPDAGMEVFNSEFAKLEQIIEFEPKKVYKALKQFAKTIKEKVPARIPIEKSKFIAMVGEMYVRRDGFSHKWLNKYFAKQGFVVKDSYISEWFFYLEYLIKEDIMEPEKSFAKKKERFVRNIYMRYAEKKIKDILQTTGYYKKTKTDIESLIKHSEHLFPKDCRGEVGLTLGVALYETIHEFCGVINIGPFGCMPTRTAEAIAVPEMKIENKIYAHRLHNPKYSLPEAFNDKMTIPFLTIETDGNVYPQVIEARLETFALQASRVGELINKAKLNGMSH